MTDIRLPNITATSPTEQLSQIKSYLYQFAEQLNYALATMDDKSEQIQQTISAASAAPSPAEAQRQAQDTFQSIKGLIIKSADIINAYSEQIETKLSENYVAQSTFGTYTENADNRITANANGISQNYNRIEEVHTENETYRKATAAYIKTGLLSENPDTYGVEVGQTNNGEFTRFSRFTTEKLSFFVNGNEEVAYISNNKLYIQTAEILQAIDMGSYHFAYTKESGLVISWVERSGD